MKRPLAEGLHQGYFQNGRRIDQGSHRNWAEISIPLREFNLGEGIEKKESNFAAEIAEATSVKAEAPKPAEPKKEEPKDDAPVEMVAVSALVKELRQMSGAV